MLYLEDYLELIEHLPQELRERFTDIRTRDLQVNNTTELLKSRISSFFVDAATKKLNPEERQCEYDKILHEYELATKYAEDKIQIADQMHEIMVILIQRLDGEIEKFKLELEADHTGITELLEKRSLELDARPESYNDARASLKDRRKSEFKNRQSFHHTQANNGFPTTNSVGRPRLSQNNSNIKKHNTSTNKIDSNGCSDYYNIQQSGELSCNRTATVMNLDNNHRENLGHPVQKFNGASSTSYGNPGFNYFKNNQSKQNNLLKNLLNDHQNQALSAALTSTPSQNSNHNNNNNNNNVNNHNNNNNSASSFAMAYGRHTKISTGSMDMDLYPDESPTSISSNNSMFENSESLSSAYFAEAGANFNSTSPSPFDFATKSRANNFYQRDDTKYCFCRQVSYGEMVACDNEGCRYEWFHYDCVGISSPPKGEWFCSSCTEKMADQYNPRAKKKGRKEKAIAVETAVATKQK